MLDLLTQITETSSEIQLELLSRKGLRIATLPVSQNHLLFGVTVDGLFYVDRVFDQNSPNVSAPLRRFQQQQILQPGREEFPGPELLQQERGALLDLTARCLRGLAGRLGASPVRVKKSPPSTTIGWSANLRFSPMELLLTRPETVTLRDDLTSQLFHKPPQGTHDAWLFALGSPYQLWPIATVNTGLKTVVDATVACQSAHQLLQFLERQGGALTEGRHHAVCMSGDGSLLLLLANVNQAVLLTLPAAQLGRVMQLTQQICTVRAEPESVAPPSNPGVSSPEESTPTVGAPERGLPEVNPAESPSSQESTVPIGPVLTLKAVTIKAGDKTLIKDLALEIPTRGVFAMMGPGGAGKSTLLGVLAGGIPGLRQQGELLYQGQPLSQTHHPVVLGQRLPAPQGTLIEYLLGRGGPFAARERLQAAELLRDAGLERLRAALDREFNTLDLSPSQSWRLAILSGVAADPALLCVDEPTAAMDQEDAQPILDLLRQIGTQRAILLVTHNQSHARSIAENVALMAAARVHGIHTVTEFFSDGASPLVREYVRTGGCHIPSPDAPLEHIDPDYLQPPTPQPSQISEPQPPQPPPPSAVLWQDAQPSLSLRSFGLRMGERCRLSQVNLDLGATGRYQIVCPDGTIRRLLHSYLTTGLPGKTVIEGEAILKGSPLDEDHHAATIELGVKLLMSSVREYLLSGYSKRMSLASIEDKQAWIAELLQSQRAEDLEAHVSEQVLELSSEQKRRLAIARTAAAKPAVLCLDEPLQGLDPESSARLLDTIDREAKKQAVLLLVAEAIPRWQGVAQTGYLHGEFLYPTEQIEPTPAEETESAAATSPDQRAAQSPAPQLSNTAVTQEFNTPDSGAVHTVSASLAETEPEIETPEQIPQVDVRRFGQGPRGFHWLIPGILAGTPEPGVMNDLDYDLALLYNAGITLLVTLTETPLDDDALSAQGLKSLFFPIVDMHAPSQRAAYDLCGLIELQLLRGERIAFHCKAGLGRTGTLLCSYLIMRGESARAALERARRVEPAWVQSKEQERFLQDFEVFCAQQRKQGA